MYGYILDSRDVGENNAESRVVGEPIVAWKNVLLHFSPQNVRVHFGRPSRAPFTGGRNLAGGRRAADDAVVAKCRRHGKATFDGCGNVNVLLIVVHCEVRCCGHSRPRDRPRFVGRRSEAWLGAFPGAVLPAYEVLPTGVVRPPLRGFVGLVDVALSPCSSSLSDEITSGPFSSPAAFAVAGRRDLARRLAPSRFKDTWGIFPPAVFWHFAATGPLSATGLPSFAPAVLPTPVLRVGLIFGAIVGAILLLLDLACYTKASGQKVRAKMLLPLFFFDNYLGKYGRYQFPPYLYQELWGF